MDDLIAFLRARETGREKNANEGHSLWCAALDPCHEGPNFGDPDYSRCDCKRRWALADVAAKRQIIDEAAQVEHLADSWPAEPDDVVNARVTMEKVLRLLALPYVDHPAYQKSWKP